MKKIANLFGIQIDALSRREVTDVLVSWLQAEESSCRYVVTPNVDHIVMLDAQADFRKAYMAASLTVVDGKPVVAAARLLGKPVPETVTGSDLVPAIFQRVADTWQKDLKVFLLGAGPGVADRAAQKIHETWAHVRVVGVYSPPFGFERDPQECQRICDLIAESGAALLVLGLGTPKQELWVYLHASRLPVKVALCVGATIDFIAGEKTRAPMWMQRLALEWLYRVWLEPRRLFMRYFRGALIFPSLVFREYRAPSMRK